MFLLIFTGPDLCISRTIKSHLKAFQVKTCFSLPIILKYAHDFRLTFASVSNGYEIYFLILCKEESIKGSSRNLPCWPL